MKGKFTKAYLQEHKLAVGKAVLIILIAACALFVFLFRTGEDDDMEIVEPEQRTAEEASASSGEDATVAGTVIVDVGGQVTEPQVVELDAGSRVEDAISAAGGLTDKADLSGINRASPVEDGMKVYIPAQGENVPASAESEGSGETTAEGQTDAKVNINSASNTELQTLNGVGPAIAEKILLYRSQNGGFQKIEDLKNVSGIGDKTFEKLKDHITV